MKSGSMSMVIEVCIDTDVDWLIEMWSDMALAHNAKDGTLLYKGPIAGLPSEILDDLIERQLVKQAM